MPLHGCQTISNASWKMANDREVKFTEVDIKSFTKEQKMQTQRRKLYVLKQFNVWFLQSNPRETYLRKFQPPSCKSLRINRKEFRVIRELTEKQSVNRENSWKTVVIWGDSWIIYSLWRVILKSCSPWIEISTDIMSWTSNNPSRKRVNCLSRWFKKGLLQGFY